MADHGTIGIPTTKRRLIGKTTTKNGKAKPTNQNAYEIANPLYDYDYGVVSKTVAKELGINNVDEKKEVKQILKYIRGGSKD